MLRHRLAALLAIAAIAIAAGSAWSASQDVSLTYDVLPSAQGWTYTPSGSHAGATEGLIFEADGTALHLRSMGQGYGVSGGSILYAINGIVSSTESKQLRVSAQVLQVEGSGAGAQGQGGNVFGYTLPTTNVQYGFSITPTNVYVLISTGFAQVTGTYDNTGFHEYIFDFAAPGTTRLYRDGVLLSINTQGFGVTGNRVFFGDGTGGANSHTVIRQLRFVQNLTTPAAPASWGRIKSLYR